MTKIQDKALMRKIKRTQKKKDDLNKLKNKRKEEEIDEPAEEDDESEQVEKQPKRPKSKFIFDKFQCL